MTKQVLIAVDGLEDARTATVAIPQVCEAGDECVILAVLDEPDTELIGSTPTHVMPEPYTGAGGSEGVRAPNDAPAVAAASGWKPAIPSPPITSRPVSSQPGVANATPARHTADSAGPAQMIQRP